MIILGIDPGHEQSAIVRYDSDDRSILNAKIGHNREIEMWVRDKSNDAVVVEMVGCYGMAVGREIFETCVQIGRFEALCPIPVGRLMRQTIKAHLCNSSRATDSNIRCALMDRWGGKDSVKRGGHLNGIKTHLWSALAVAVTYAELKGNAKP